MLYLSPWVKKFTCFFTLNKYRGSTLLFSGLTEQEHTCIIHDPFHGSSPLCASFMSRDLTQLSSTEPSGAELSSVLLGSEDQENPSPAWRCWILHCRRHPAGSGITMTTAAGHVRRDNSHEALLHRTRLCRMWGRLKRAHFRGCEKRGGIPFEAGSSAMRKSGLQRGGLHLQNTLKRTKYFL